MRERTRNIFLFSLIFLFGCVWVNGFASVCSLAVRDVHVCVRIRRASNVAAAAAAPNIVRVRCACVCVRARVWPFLLVCVQCAPVKKYSYIWEATDDAPTHRNRRSDEWGIHFFFLLLCVQFSIIFTQLMCGSARVYAMRSKDFSVYIHKQSNTIYALPVRNVCMFRSCDVRRCDFNVKNRIPTIRRSYAYSVCGERGTHGAYWYRYFNGEMIRLKVVISATQKMDETREICERTYGE